MVARPAIEMARVEQRQRSKMPRVFRQLAFGA
jgi:hypothetical protein